MNKLLTMTLLTIAFVLSGCEQADQSATSTSDAGGGIAGNTSTPAEDAVETAEGVAAPAFESSKELAAETIDAGKDAASNLAEGAKDMTGKALDNAKEIAAQGIDEAKDAAVNVAEDVGTPTRAINPDGTATAEGTKEAISNTMTKEKETALGGVSGD